MDTGDEGGPEADAEDWDDHAGEDGAVHAHEVGELGVAIEVAWSNLPLVSLPRYTMSTQGEVEKLELSILTK